MAPFWILIALFELSNLIESSQIIPPLYRYDDFEQCHRENNTGVYCYVKVVFEGERDPLDSPRIISDFRRNLLDWGICAAECQRELEEIREEDRQSLFQPKFSINFTYIFPPELWGEYLDPFKAHYGELINVCVNNRLRRVYNFGRLAYSEIEYCTVKEPLRKTPHWLMITFYAIVLTLIGTLIGANVLELFGFDKIKDHILVSSFSVRRNWNRLTEQSNSELYRDFGYIDGVRVVLSMLVMSFHFLLIAGIIPSKYPEYVEEVVQSPLMIDLMASCAVLVQTFLTISGLLLTTNFLKDHKDKPSLEPQYFWEKIKNRLIRIAPVYYFFLLITIVVADLPGVQVSTHGYKTLIQEQARCMKKWWINVLFLINLPSFDGEVCNLQGWYLAADQQLFLATLLILTACWMFPKHASSILSSSMAVALAIPAGIVYMYKLESTMPLRLSETQLLVMYQSWIRHVYMPGYSNLGSYMAGVIVGYLYHHHKNNKFDLVNHSLYKIAKKSRIPLLALAYLPSFIFFRYEIPRSSWLTIIHTILYRNAGIFAVSVTFIECFLNPPGLFRKFLSSKPMSSLGKLSYSVYVLHVPLGRVILNGYGFSSTVDVQLSSVIWMIPIIGLNYLVALLVYFCFEQPATLLLKYFLIDKRTCKKSIK